MGVGRVDGARPGGRWTSTLIMGGGEWPLTRPGTRFSPPPHQPPATRGVRWETPGEVQKDPPGSPGHPKTQSFSKREASGYSTRENNVRGFPYGGGGG